MQDIEKTCKRIIIIDNGKIVYDGSVSEIRQKYGKERTLVVEFGESYKNINIAGVKTVDDNENPNKKSFVFSKEVNVHKLISDISSEHVINDLTIKEPEIEGIIREIYEGSSIK
jgi:ABC-2 type transport system ATP-binding protein